MTESLGHDDVKTTAAFFFSPPLSSAVEPPRAVNVTITPLSVVVFHPLNALGSQWIDICVC